MTPHTRAMPHKTQAERIEHSVWASERIHCLVTITGDEAGDENRLKHRVLIQTDSYVNYLQAKKIALNFGYDKGNFTFLALV